MRAHIAKLARSVRTHGAAATWTLAKKNIAHELRWYFDRRFDRLHGTETSDRIELADLDVLGEHRDQGVYYEPTSTRIFRHIMDQVAREIPCEEFTFIDYGSGKGRTLLMASDYPFRGITGVEFSIALHQTALRNILAYRGHRQRCMDLQSVHADARYARTLAALGRELMRLRRCAGSVCRRDAGRIPGPSRDDGD